MEGVDRAFSAFGSKAQLNAMRRRAMARASGWQNSARSYANLYRHVVPPITPGMVKIDSNSIAALATAGDLAIAPTQSTASAGLDGARV